MSSLFNKKSILFLTRYTRKGASSRYRFFQFFSILESENICCEASPFFDDEYLDHLYKGKFLLFDYIKAFVRRFLVLFKLKNYGLVIIEKEIFPYVPSVVERFLRFWGVAYCVDYDDARFIQYQEHQNLLIRFLFKKKINVVIRNSSLVIAGNQYLADYAKYSGARKVEILPTVVDTERYAVSYQLHPADDEFRICWIGTPKTQHYLQLVVPVLQKLAKKERIRLVIIGGDVKDLKDIPIEVLSWSEQTEVRDIQSCDVGIMPLLEGDWEKGKCGLKLIQYMAAGLPVIASDVGVNKEIIQHANNGFLVRSMEEWGDALRKIYKDQAMAQKMGLEGRRLVENHYSLKVIGECFKNIILNEFRKERD